ncbi:MAG: hypothetical protein KME49_25690 [Brasilonema octagenarum HA4186-MV1]|jgi:hypothetical protein|nr:hypothetical protein [Brasilonema octagenarum HA4186-MV1]
MIKYFAYLAEYQLQEYYKYWSGYYPGTWQPKNEYANRCYDRYERLCAVITFLKHNCGN